MISQDKDDSGIRSASGRSLDELTMDAALRGDLTEDDFRISAASLRRQAEAAEAAGNWQLGENLRRAAELTRVTNEEVLAIYNTLRPGRTSYHELMALAVRLETVLGAPLTAELVREAAHVYLDQGLVSPEDDDE